MHRQQTLPALTGARGIAAVVVIMFHFDGFSKLLNPLGLLKPIYSVGYLGVDFFFILSGFIMSYVYVLENGSLSFDSYLNFLSARIARIYPVQLATVISLGFILLFASILHIKVNGSYPLSCIPSQLTMTQAWPFVPGACALSWNYPSWSMSAEWFAYLLVYPACCLLYIGRLSSVSYLLAVFLLLSLFQIVDKFLKIGQFGPVLQVTLEFTAGVATYLIFSNSGKILKLLQSKVDWVIVLTVGCLYVGVQRWIILLFPFILIGLTGRGAFASKILATKPMLWLGTISYSLYMTHAIVQKTLKPVLPIDSYSGASLSCRIFIALVYFSTIILVACLFYYGIENPMRDIIRKKFTDFGHIKLKKPTNT